MRPTLLAAGLLASTVAGAPSTLHRNSERGYASGGGQQPFSFPLDNGFPNIAQGSDALLQIQREAHGTLPNGALPKSISDTSAVIWSLIAFNELFEVAYFTSLMNNISSSVPNYEIGSSAATQIVMNALTAVRAQEELHALGANGILQTAGRTPIQPCKYIFPVADFDSAITFASTFTDLVLATLQEALKNFSLDGDGPDFIGLVGSVIGQEGEQNGFYRRIGEPSRIPSSQPFLTAGSGPFALSALYQNVIVPKSCPQTLPIPIFGALNVETSDISSKTTELTFSIENNSTDAQGAEAWSLVYINGQNQPVVEKLTGIRKTGFTIEFSAPFPYAQFQMDGLTIAAVTKNAGPFANATEVAAATLYGPGLIEVN